MKKKNKIDFVIYENDDEKTVFRFYPRQSHCHSFGDEPPTSWKEVYKVYYHYEIFHLWKDDNFHQVLFDSGCDECSIIDEISYRIKLIAQGEKSCVVTNPFTKEEHTTQLMDIDVFPYGDGITWNIQEDGNGYGLYLWDRQGVGYRFNLNEEKLKAFGEYLNECCEYMLAHGEPI